MGHRRGKRLTSTDVPVGSGCDRSGRDLGPVTVCDTENTVSPLPRHGDSLRRGTRRAPPGRSRWRQGPRALSRSRRPGPGPSAGRRLAAGRAAS
eukprot:118492-Rhodomonas_salina.2